MFITEAINVSPPPPLDVQHVCIQEHFDENLVDVIQEKKITF
jgi:hypothetical protein